ncbi:uncharacterized protein LOC100216790 isoform 1 [Zea mays]|uniref:SWIM-type domain-containing protein n=1 Tax=Zea mays TaxID=4577 RepID=C4J099_MAIZE|nr:uncharacterized protein LOC100216790 isoform 1 [Zea mays]ACR34599.1 unknown [Zea mays]|eukprot:NP_001266871.1 uncharacterized protein LOC100216790 [Zea mays]
MTKRERKDPGRMTSLGSLTKQPNLSWVPPGYRGFCKAKKCNWRIHASQLPDGKTWQVKKMSKRHYCRSRSKMEKNCMANQYWVRDKVVPMLRENPNLGAGALVKKLQEKYLIQVSYCVAWKGKELALDELMGKWEDSFDHIYAFKAAIEKESPGSVVEIQTEKVGEKIRFCKMFVAFKACIDGFLQGCRPYLGIDSTVLTGRWKGQLASAVAIDGHNWMFPVALGLFESESKDSWKWFMEKLQTAIGSPHGLVISTDAGKGIDSALTNAFNNGVEHRECVRHLFKNFQKRFHGEVFERNLWPAARAYRRTVHDKHYNIMKIASPAAIKWLEDTHKHLWARCYFSTASKCDYVTNNIAETFNCWIKDEKSLPPVELIDRIRQKILEKFFVRKNLADKLTGTILPSVMKQLHDAGRGLVGYVVHKGPDHTAEVSGVHKDLTPWRHTIDLVNRECSCKKWQLTGLPCTHALSVIGCFRNLKLEDYVDSYYSVEKFKTAYVGKIPTLTDKTEWEQPEVGYKVWPPILKRAAGSQGQEGSLE